MEMPSYITLMKPTLHALDSLGGSGNTDHINQRVIELMQIPEELVAVEYPEVASQSGSKLLHRLAFARTYLKKLSAVESAGWGEWAITDIGREYLALEEAQLRHDEHELRVGKTPELFLRSVQQGVHTDSISPLTVRDLLLKWEVKRRGADVVQRIRRDLADVGAATNPEFDTVGLDDEVEIVPLPRGSSHAPEPEVRLEPQVASRTITIGTLESARSGLTRVDPSDDIRKAQSIMESRDFSQLAVSSGSRDLRGSISWESIARASLHRLDVSIVQDAMDANPVVVRDSEPLLDHVERIAQSGFVFVIDNTKQPVGIVTTADLSIQFAITANPFLIVGEIERWLRFAVDSKFDADELSDFADPDDPERQIDGAHSLTFGEYVRLLENPEAWGRVAWHADRRVFVQHLDEVRQIRNEIMHFGPDPIGETELLRLKAMIQWLKRLIDH